LQRPEGQIYDPFNQVSGARQAYGLDPGDPSCLGNCIPARIQQGCNYDVAEVFPAANVSGAFSEQFRKCGPAGGNTNEFVVRGDQNIGITRAYLDDLRISDSRISP